MCVCVQVFLKLCVWRSVLSFHQVGFRSPGFQSKHFNCWAIPSVLRCIFLNNYFELCACLSECASNMCRHPWDWKWALKVNREPGSSERAATAPNCVTSPALRTAFCLFYSFWDGVSLPFYHWLFWSTLHRPGWPHRDLTGLCLPSAGTRGVCHHTWHKNMV